jgi:hypothetical protein
MPRKKHIKEVKKKNAQEARKAKVQRLQGELSQPFWPDPVLTAPSHFKNKDIMPILPPGEEETYSDDDPGVVEQSELDHFNAILQKAQYLAAEAERQKKPQKRPKTYNGNSKRTRRRHKKQQKDLAKQGYLPVFDFIAHIKAGSAGSVSGKHASALSEGSPLDECALAPLEGSPMGECTSPASMPSDSEGSILGERACGDTSASVSSDSEDCTSGDKMLMPLNGSASGKHMLALSEKHAFGEQVSREFTSEDSEQLSESGTEDLMSERASQVRRCTISRSC